MTKNRGGNDGSEKWIGKNTAAKGYFNLIEFNLTFV